MRWKQKKPKKKKTPYQVKLKMRHQDEKVKLMILKGCKIRIKKQVSSLSVRRTWDSRGPPLVVSHQMHIII